MSPLSVPSFAISITDLELAINYWRGVEAIELAEPLPESLSELAQLYGQMIWEGLQHVDAALLSPTAMQAWLDWYETTPDTPCIAICSTSQGDEVCKGCGRSFDEVKNWAELSPVAKRAVWNRIQRQGTAWRFNKYSERAVG
ncbi:MAG: hypothetical protein RLZZ397_1465 [Pseudomonadota bacterium]|jgi:predicted Fe-S protein YdhL (DUF1289 family)